MKKKETVLFLYSAPRVHCPRVSTLRKYRSQESISVVILNLPNGLYTAIKSYICLLPLALSVRTRFTVMQQSNAAGQTDRRTDGQAQAQAYVYSELDYGTSY